MSMRSGYCRLELNRASSSSAGPRMMAINAHNIIVFVLAVISFVVVRGAGAKIRRAIGLAVFCGALGVRVSRDLAAAHCSDAVQLFTDRPAKRAAGSCSQESESGALTNPSLDVARYAIRVKLGEFAEPVDSAGLAGNSFAGKAPMTWDMRPIGACREWIRDPTCCQGGTKWLIPSASTT